MRTFVKWRLWTMWQVVHRPFQVSEYPNASRSLTPKGGPNTRANTGTMGRTRARRRSPRRLARERGERVRVQRRPHSHAYPLCSGVLSVLEIPHGRTRQGGENKKASRRGKHPNKSLHDGRSEMRIKRHLDAANTLRLRKTHPEIPALSNARTDGSGSSIVRRFTDDLQKKSDHIGIEVRSCL
jgi:hypothetical protein